MKIPLWKIKALSYRNKIFRMLLKIFFKIIHVIQIQTISIQKQKRNFDTPYVISEECHIQFKDHISDGLLFLHINIRSINNNFENFSLCLPSSGFTFSVICFSETWLDETTSSNKSLYKLPNYTSIHQVRKLQSGYESHFLSNNLYSLKYGMI